MNGCAWVVLDEHGTKLRTTEPFSDRTAAEAWLGDAWTELVDEGGDAVVLVEGGTEVYRMGLGAP